MRTVTYTAYNEAGGMGKTTLAANLGAAHARAGLQVLLVDLDPQNGDLSYLLGVDDDRADASVDSLDRHLVDEPRGPFADLVREAFDAQLELLVGFESVDARVESEDVRCGRSDVVDSLQELAIAIVERAHRHRNRGWSQPQ